MRRSSPAWLTTSILFVACSSNPVTFEAPDDIPPGTITPGPIPDMEYGHVPPGIFEMGSPGDDPDAEDDEYPAHTVTFDYSFEIMTTEVTQAMWDEVLARNPSYFDGDDRPVEHVSLGDCQDFIDALNAIDTAHQYRLPSEAEWEYCCCAGSQTRYYWGEDPGFGQIGSNAWFAGNAAGETHPVAQKLPNAWGLYDMSGNVWEWCADCWHDDYVGAPADGSPWMTPPSAYRVGRGGSWGYTAPYCRSANRGIFAGDFVCNYLGFRLVRTVRS